MGEVCGCDDCGNCGTRTILECRLEKGSYSIVVDGYSTSEGSFEISFTCATPAPTTSPTTSLTTSLTTSPTSESPSCYTDYQPNTGLFPDDHIIQQRELISQQDCKAWCDQYSNCLAAVISPSSWAYRECFLVSTSSVTSRDGWSAAIKTPCPVSELESVTCGSIYWLYRWT